MGINDTLGQASHTLTTIGQRDPNDDHVSPLQHGYRAIRNFLRSPPVELITTIDFSKTTDELIVAGKYDWKSDFITADRFPVEGGGTKRFRNRLFYFGRDISSAGVVAAMHKEKFTPASHVHGLVFGATFPDMQRRCPIACLGSSAQVRGYRSVLCLNWNVAQRYIHLRPWGDDWIDYWRFLGVQEVPGADA